MRHQGMAPTPLLPMNVASQAAFTVSGFTRPQVMNSPPVCTLLGWGDHQYPATTLPNNAIILFLVAGC